LQYEKNISRGQATSPKNKSKKVLRIFREVIGQTVVMYEAGKYVGKSDGLLRVRIVDKA
jgi:hypothetical protein